MRALFDSPRKKQQDERLFDVVRSSVLGLKYRKVPGVLHVLIGHRGVGKTAFLTRISRYYGSLGASVLTLDLDQIIASQESLSVAALFARDGEAAFREIERQTLDRLILLHRSQAETEDVYIAVGAGFAGELPTGVNVLWVRRLTDAAGRTFPAQGPQQRPRLNADVGPLQEYRERFFAREKRYAKSCREVFTVLEGFDVPNAAEQTFVQSCLANPPEAPPDSFRARGVLSLLPQNFCSGGTHLDFSAWLSRRLAFSGLRFELRDDLLDPLMLTEALARVPAPRRIYSFRRAIPDAAQVARAAAGGGAWDYPLELGLDSVPPQPAILSLHERLPGETLLAAAARLTAAGARCGAAVLKLAAQVESFAELLDGWRWSCEAPLQRAFLPRASENSAGRWRWFRLLTAQRMPLSFIREGDGTSPDQPLLAEYLQHGVLGSERFAAVLGNPVQHSRTPAEHHEFFAARGIPIVAIPLSNEEWSEGALDILRQLGLRYAAVTAPLKGAAAALVERQSAAPAPIESLAVNTLYFCERTQRWQGTNTDLLGAQELLGGLAAEPAVAVWGGGGTLPVVQAVLPQACLFSARTGTARSAPHEPNWPSFGPAVVIWAAGNLRGGAAPPGKWRPRLVVDLSYAEDSLGREYAVRIGAEYASGLPMFKAQAAAQRIFWTRVSERSGFGFDGPLRDGTP